MEGEEARGKRAGKEVKDRDEGQPGDGSIQVCPGHRQGSL